MVYTIREMIAKKGRTLAETDYAHSNADMLDFRLISGDFYEWNGGKLRFKECADVMDFAQVSEAFPPFAQIRYKSREKFPYFASDLNILLKAWKQGETVAVEGGPCLFGEYEVTVLVHLRNGETRLFDYANGRAYPHEDGNPHEGGEHKGGAMDFSEAEGLADYLRVYGGQVESISFRQEKQGLTPQEYLNLRYPFEIAAALGGPLVIPVPDMSYRKFLLAVLDFVPEALREPTLAEFDAVTERITAFYLDAIAKLQARFQIARFTCVHSGNRDALETWYGKRAAYIERHKILRHLTRIPEKLEAVKDYISMPALPLYLFGTANILEVNIMTEADSYRKCKAAHRNAARIGCLLFPELFSGDGIHMYYFAPPRWKEYGNYDEGVSGGDS